MTVESGIDDSSHWSMVMGRCGSVIAYKKVPIPSVRRRGNSTSDPAEASEHEQTKRKLKRSSNEDETSLANGDSIAE